MSVESHVPYPASPAWSPQQKRLWLLLGGAVCFLFGLALLVRLNPRPDALHDFVQEWTSAKNALSGRPVYLELRKSVPLYFGAEYHVPRVGATEVNAHPPVSVLCVLPFAGLDYQRAYVAWNVLSLVCLVVSVWFIMRPAGLNFSPWFVLPFATFLLSSNSLAQQVNQGQFNLLLLLLLTLAWTAERADRPALSGLCLGAAAAIKLFPAALGLYYLCQRRWTGLATMVLTFLLLNGLALACLGPDCFRAYVYDVMPRVAEFRTGWPNASITGFWYKLLGTSGHTVQPLWPAPALAAMGTVLTSLAVIAATGWKCWRARTRPERDLAFGLSIIAILLLSPITWDHYFLLLLLSFAVLWKVLPANRIRRYGVIAAVVILTTINPKWIWDLTVPGDGEYVMAPSAVLSVATPGHVLTVISYQFYGLLTLFVFTLLSRPAATGDKPAAPVASSVS